MQTSNIDIYKILAQLLQDPAVLGGLGSGVLSVGLYLSNGAKAVIKSIFTGIVNAFKERKNNKKEEGKGKDHTPPIGYSRNGLEIHKVLENLRAKLDCSRVSILQFHNGHHFSLSDPVFKMSTTFEAIAPGFVPSSTEFRELLVANHINVVAPILLPNNPVAVPGVTEVDTCLKDKQLDACQRSLVPLRIVKVKRDDIAFGAFRTVMDRLGIEAAYAVVLLSPIREPFGLLLIQFHDLNGSRNTIQTSTCDICVAKHTIEALLYTPA